MAGLLGEKGGVGNGVSRVKGGGCDGGRGEDFTSKASSPGSSGPEEDEVEKAVEVLQAGLDKMKHILKLKRSAQTTSIEDLLFCELPPIISRFSSGSKHRSGNKSPPVPHKLHHKQAIAVCKTSSVLTPQKQQRVHEEQSLQGTGTRCLKKSTGLPKGKEAIESGKSKPPVPPSSPSPQPQEGHEHISSLSKISRKHSSPQPDAKYKSESGLLVLLSVASIAPPPPLLGPNQQFL